MAEGNSESEGDIDPRGLGVVLLVAALMALAVGGGMLLTRHDDTPRADPAPVRTTAPVPTTFRPPTSVLQFPRTTARVPVAPPVGLESRRVGDDCSANGITARWELTPYAGWVCTPVSGDR
ncbi:hypothetical protein [Nocardia sp. NPDC050406]|uniref:hypothetical protein n=1 Tax=Nocardia sp. NPDC050406 TaxID=3364318 RepID=UPI0037B72A93